MNKFYITTSIVYVNGPPHIGFALELIQADVIARFNRYLGKDVQFLTGTDEHGLKIYRKAKEKGKTPQEFVNEMSFQYRVLIEKLNISNNLFIRTTDKDIHLEGVQKVWRKLQENGDIYKKKYKGCYCSGCEEFKREKELVDGKCLDHDKKPELIEEENYFFRLSKYSGKIKEAIEKGKIEIIPESRKNETLRFLEEEVEDISVSRLRKNLPWGISVPGDEDQTIYVWVDALSNYITSLGYKDEREEFQKYWPADVHCVGKDISRFHCVIWPGILFSLGLELPKKIFIHGFMTVEGKKMSKSLGNVVDPFELVEKYGTDAVRYYFLREVPATRDGDFSKEKFKERYNADLADGLGNLVSRTIALAGKYKVGESGEPTDKDIEKKVGETKREKENLLEEFKFNEALGSVWELIHFADRYVEEKKPWEKREENESVVKNLLYILASLSEMLSPFLPETAEKIKNQLQNKEKSPLFPKLK